MCKSLIMVTNFMPICYLLCLSISFQHYVLTSSYFKLQRYIVEIKLLLVELTTNIGMIFF